MRVWDDLGRVLGTQGVDPTMVGEDPYPDPVGKTWEDLRQAWQPSRTPWGRPEKTCGIFWKRRGKPLDPLYGD